MVFYYFILVFFSIVYIFIKGYDQDVFAIPFYVLAFYVVIFFSVWLCGVVKTIYIKVNKNKIYRTYKDNLTIQMKTTLFLGIFINALYGLLKLFMGIYYQSEWFITFATYYLLLSFMRLLLLKNVRKNELEKNIQKEYKKLKLCGIFLLFMNFVLSGMIILIIVQNRFFEYPGYLIYVIAFYDFYLIINAFIKVFQYRKHTSPLFSASKCINLTVAMISMISLETAMLTQFGSETDHFNIIMISCTGFGVCVINSLMSIYMIIKANKSLKYR